MQPTKRVSPNLPISDDQTSQSASNQPKSSQKPKPVSRSDVINHVKHAVEGISSKIDKNSLNKIFVDIETEEGSSYFISAINDVFDKYVSSSTLKALTVLYIILLKDTFPNFNKILQFYLPEILTLTTVTYKKPKDMTRDSIHLLARSIFLYITNHQNLPDPSYFGFDKNNMLFQFLKENSISKRTESSSTSKTKSLKSFSSNISVDSPSIELNDQYGDNLIDFDLYEPKEKSSNEFTMNTVDLIDSNEFDIDVKSPQKEENISLQPKPELTIDDVTFVDTKSSIDLTTLQKNPSAPFKPNLNSFQFVESDKGSLSTPSINKNQNQKFDDNPFIDLTQSSFSNSTFKPTDSLNSKLSYDSLNQKSNNNLLDSFNSSQQLTSDLLNSKLTSDSFNSNQQINNNLLNSDNQQLNNNLLNSDNQQLNSNLFNSNQQINNNLLNSDNQQINNNLLNSDNQQINNNLLNSDNQQINTNQTINDFTGTNKSNNGILKRDTSNNSNARQVFDDYYKSADDKKKTKFNVQHITNQSSPALTTTVSLSELPITHLKESNDTITPSKSEVFNGQSFIPFEDCSSIVNNQHFFVCRVSLPEQVEKDKIKPIPADSPFGYEQTEHFYKELQNNQNELNTTSQNTIHIQKIDLDLSHQPNFIENNIDNEIYPSKPRESLGIGLDDDFEPISQDQNAEFVPITPIGSNLISLDDDTSDQFEPITPITNNITTYFDSNAENTNKAILSDSNSDSGDDQFVPITPVHSSINNVNNDDFEPITPKKDSLNDLDRYARFNQNLMQENESSNEGKNSFSDNFVPITPIDENTLIPNRQIDDKTNFSDNFVPLPNINENNVISMQNAQIDSNSDQFTPITPIEENFIIPNRQIEDKNSFSDNFVPITPIDENNIIPLQNTQIDSNSNQFTPITPDEENNIIQNRQVGEKNTFSDGFVPITPIDENHIISMQNTQIDSNSNQFTPITPNEDNFVIPNKYPDLQFPPILPTDQFAPIDGNPILLNNKRFSIEHNQTKNDFSDQFSPITPIDDDTVIPNTHTDFSDQFVPISLADEDSVIPIIKKNEDYSDQFVPISQAGSEANLVTDDELLNKNQNQFELLDNYEPILQNEEMELPPDENESKSKGKTRFNIHITSSASMDIGTHRNSKESASILFDKE